MKQYLQGALCMTAVIMLTAIIAMLSRSKLSQESLELLIGVIFITGAVFLGYIYKRWNGPLIFASDQKAYTRLFPFVLGVGTVLGPVKLFLTPFPINDVAPIANLLLAILSIPLSGLSVLGAMLIGSLFCKRVPTWL